MERTRFFMTDVNGNEWMISREAVVADMHDWAAKNTESKSFGYCIFTADVEDWVTERNCAIPGWVLLRQAPPTPSFPEAILRETVVEGAGVECNVLEF